MTRTADDTIALYSSKLRPRGLIKMKRLGTNDWTYDPKVVLDYMPDNF